MLTSSDGRSELVGQTTIAAFQHAWFEIAAAQHGCAGTAKWDCYYGMYDKGQQAYYAIGQPGVDGWPLYPMYFVLWLLAHAVPTGWRALGVERKGAAAGTKELAVFAGEGGRLTVLGLDTGGATLERPSPEPPVTYAIGGLPAGTSRPGPLGIGTARASSPVAARSSSTPTGSRR